MQSRIISLHYYVANILIFYTHMHTSKSRAYDRIFLTYALRRTRTRARTNTNKHTNKRTNKHTNKHTNMHTNTHTYVHTYKHAPGDAKFTTDLLEGSGGQA